MYCRKTNHYLTRTVEHIHRVQNNMVTLLTKYADQLELTKADIQAAMYSVMNHDRSKFNDAQFDAYIELTEYYRQKKDMKNADYQYPEGVEAKVDIAVNDHYVRENHHPERAQGGIMKYSILEAIETVCDLQAMAQEFNEGSCRAYYNDVWVKKQAKHFSDDYNWFETTSCMLLVISCFENELRLKGK